MGELRKQLFITINKQEGRERELLFVDCNRVFFSSLCVYRLNKIQMNESTREGLLSLFAFTINRRLLFLNSHSTQPSAGKRKTLHALYVVVEVMLAAGEEVREIYSIETTLYIMKSRAIFFF